eukprot:TRINITY_DN4421_c0_g1_i1.p1 TRINITY_DN4421_c0_g1~~TRINITY_DN4421_c0_g1_i1.p1  ORF type:complete len:1057 (+),score=384.38 TRINITY_DN4421_c0_g1_i1:68-3238(+)
MQNKERAVRFEADVEDVLRGLRVDYKGAVCDRLNRFLRALQQLLTKDAPPPIRPRHVSLSGAYLLRCVTALNPSVDVLLTAPQSWCPADRLRQHGWLVKRKEYLALLSGYLTDPGVAEVFGGVLCVEHREGDSGPGAKSFLAIAGPKTGSGGECWEVRLHVSLQLPDALRDHFRTPQVVQVSPYYSQAVLEDAMALSVSERLHGAWARLPVLCDCMLLVRQWVAKRGLAEALPDHALFLLLLHLAETGRFVGGMAATQAFRAFLHFAAVLPDDVELCPPPDNALHQPESARTKQLKDALKASSSCVLRVSGANAWYQVPEEAAEELRMAAKAGLSLLDSTAVPDAAGQLFLLPSAFWFRYDVYCRTRWPNAVSPEGSRAHPDAAMTLRRDYVTKIRRAVRQYLPNVASRIYSRHTTTDVVLGISLAHSDALRLRMIEGPPLVDTAGVAAFNAVWGTERTRSRQTADGVVRRVALFEDGQHEDSPAADLMRLGRVLTALIRQTCGAGDAVVSVVGADILNAVSIPVDPSHASTRYYDPMHSLQPHLQQAFGALQTYLLDLSDFPVGIVNVHAAHAALRKTAVVPPRPHPSLLRRHDPAVPEHLLSRFRGVEPMEVVIEFEATNVWPDHLEAVQNLKQAFYCRIAQRLRRERRLVCLPRKDCVDVLLHGVVFRLYINHSREVLLLSLLGHEARSALLERQLSLVPQHSQMVHAYALRSSSYALACRLLKRWAGAHLLHGFIGDETFELLTAAVYASASPPGGAVPGFIRTLALIESWDWDDVPLVVPSATEDDPHQHSRCRAAFEAVKRKGIKPAMWISAPYAPDRSPFTQAKPSSVMVRRMQALAKATLTTYLRVADDASGDTWERWASLFTTSMKPYDMLLQLNRDLVPEPLLSINPAPLPKTESVPLGHLFREGNKERHAELHGMVAYDPIGWLLRTLHAHFHKAVVWAYDPYGGSVIAAVALRKLSSEAAGVLAEHCQRMGIGIVRRAQLSTALVPSSPAAQPAKKRKAGSFSPALRPKTPPSAPASPAASAASRPANKGTAAVGQPKKRRRKE